MSASPVSIPTTPADSTAVAPPSLAESIAGQGEKFAPPPFAVHRFTVAQYEALGRLGILTEDDNVELLEGWIVPKMTKHPRHDGTIDLVQFLLTRLLPAGWYPRVQNVVVTDDSEPEPDIAIVPGRPGDHREQHPRGSEVSLVIEVAEATVARDRQKAGLYARAGIPHYWIVNLDQRQIEWYSQPAVEGTVAKYNASQILRSDEEGLPVFLSGAAVGSLTVGEILG